MVTFQKALRLSGIIAVLAFSLSAQTELIRNGSFSSGSTNWNLGQYGGNSSGSVTGGEYRIVVTTAGSEHWHVQFTQSALSLVQGKNYVFSFDAYKGTQNSGSQSMQVNIGQSSSPYTSYFGSQNQIVTLTTSKTRYTYTITMTGAGDQNARVEFNCGKSTGGFYIDNVSLYENVATTPRLSAVPLALDFGSVVSGAATTSNVTLQNTGNAPTVVNALQTSSGVFAAGLSTPATVPAAGSLTLPITFTPSSAGFFSGTATIYSNASDNPAITLNLSGEAVLPGIGYTPSALVFSTAPGASSSQTITLSNTGSTPITWSLTSGSAWAAVSPASGSIPAGSQVTVDITATGSAVGTFTGSLSLTHSAANMASPVTIGMSLSVSAGYQPTSPFILHPETAIDFIRDIATFRMKARDNTNGGFYTDINRQGYSSSSNLKALCGQSRIAYAFTRAFMVTGEEQYLEYAHHALKFLYDHGWNNGWYFVTDPAGNHISHWGHDDWWSFQQHYALVGITAMVEVTGGKMNWNDGSQSDLSWLMRGVNSNYTRLWDSNPAVKGYYNKANTSWTSRWGKGFTPTVDGATTHAELLALMYDSLNHRQRFIDLADNIVDHMVSALPATAAGFPENFNADWSIDYSSTSMDVGHGYKTAWVLQRAYLCNPGHPEYLTGAQALMQDLWDNGCYDTVYGAPYSYVNWQTGAITGTNKDFWMTEQGLTAGLISYYTAATQAQRDMYMRVADGSINFFMNHIMDPVYGEAYAVVSRDGSSVVDASKGGLFTAGYHSTELGYYTYLYSSLYYHKTPVQLYYFYPAESSERTFRLTPIAIEDDLLKILAVTRDGVTYNDFDADARTIHLPAGIGGKFKVTFGFTPAATYTITATAGDGGSVSPGGTITVTEGNSQMFSIIPATGYRIDDVLVDGTSMGGIASYAFSDVIADHTIAAVFNAIPTYAITAVAGEGGTISPAGITAVYENGSQSFSITPATGYRIGDVLVDGTSVGTVASYTLSNVTASHTISVVFNVIPTYTITASAGEGGSITPSGTVTVSEGASPTFTFTPATGYSIESVKVDGSAVGTASTYTFTNITENHTISAAFALKSYTITASAGTGGSISPSGTVSVQHGSSQTFAVTPSTGYQIANVLVDGVSAGTTASYTFSSVTGGHTISATFSVISSTVYQINCGGSASSPYTADQYYSGGTARKVTNTITTTGVTNPAPQAVYKAERYGTSTYTLPNLTAGASYTVRLHFAETYWTAAGKRRFNVAINGSTVLSNYDIYSVTGARYKALVRDFTATANGSGQIVIKFTTVTDNATIEGIEIIRN